MAETKELIASAITRAQANLAEALAALDKIPAIDPNSVAFAAHALNNYLTVTSMTVELVLQHMGDQLEPQLRVWLEGIRHATELMVRTAGQLMSAAVHSEAKLRFEVVDLPLGVQRACSYYQGAAQQKGIRIVIGPAVGVPPVWTDRVAAAAVLDNLLSNAVKYSEPGKQVSVEFRGETGWAVCGVHNEGPGLSREDIERLFQRGVRLTPRPTAGEGSAGFGLAVAKELIEKLGGQIWCESVPGQGCCFWIRLPAHQEPAAPTTAGAGTG